MLVLLRDCYLSYEPVNDTSIVTPIITLCFCLGDCVVLSYLIYVVTYHLLAV